MYADVSVVVDGALEEDETFHDETLLTEYLKTIEEDAEADGYLTEVYVVWHDHDDLKEDEECACVQYLTDHKPYLTFNSREVS